MFRFFTLFYGAFASVAVAAAPVASAPSASDAPMELGIETPVGSSAIRLSGTAGCDVLEPAALAVYHDVAQLNAHGAEPYTVRKRTFGPVCTVTVTSTPAASK